MRTLKISILLGCLVLVSLAINGCGGSSGSSGGTSSNPVPVLTSMNPPSVTAGSVNTGVTLTGSNFMSTSTVLWNGNALPTTYSSATSLSVQVPAADLQTAGTASVTVKNPGPGGGTSAALSFTIMAAAQSPATVVNVVANDLAWDPVNQVIYLSLPSLAATNGNTVQVLAPSTATLMSAVSAGSEPDLLSVSANSKYLYVALDGSSNVQRMTLPSLGLDIEIPLGSSSIDGAYVARDLQAAPNADGTMAVVRGTPGYSPEEEGGVEIYDDSTLRPDVLCGWIEPGCTNNSGISTGLYDSIQWKTDGSEMYAANNETTGYDFYTVPVTAAGFGTVTDYGGVSAFYADIHYDAPTGYVYFDSGTVINPVNGSKVGTFSASGLMVPDGTMGAAFFLGQPVGEVSSTYVLESFDIHKFTPIASITITNVVGTPTHLIRWGSNGLAFTTKVVNSKPPSGAVYLVSGSFVSASGSNLLPAPRENVQRTWQPTTTK